MAEIYEEFDDGIDTNIEEAPKPVAKVEETKIPPKYAGKSLEDIISMHQEAEKLIGRQGQEIGEVRKLADQLIQRDLKPTTENKEESADEIDFFVDPKAAVERAVNQHPKLKEAEEKTAQLDKFLNQQRLEKSHPDMYDIVENPDFVDWVKKSKIRQSLYMQAHKNFDYDAADELLSTFKELRGRQQQAQANEEVTDLADKASKTFQKAVVSAGSSQEAPRKIYRRADLIRLQIEDRDRYDALQPEIMAAYAEGRVR